ncbi:MAG: 3-deoxy-manno-octulosonate cytidylyltransferase [Bacteroidales bacterium]|nr:3-deoxy-manno-octulosonate cytidylyltransferase [Bacteroidales bacterium]MCM1147671.1 3-deoxy-manno-octulosonate cytidylyltransferase [Bacteroidales bacterium]MCM1206801.1 3-deoxy-manno-octulosonate cytidylyltransferase [Bacillota bacterium]MCM1510701.1 3-deoxy-manno-octulosonate cytidylyltransferase [Clostridium sp.]
MKFIAVIPARYASTRFPGKPLAMLGGKTVIERVYTQTKKVIENVFVATDDERIRDAVMQFGGEVVMTRADHKSGTDRIEEAVSLLDSRLGLSPDDIVINVQGDEPFIQPSQIESVMKCFEDGNTQIATLGKPFCKDIAAIGNPNSPKIAVSQQGYALYFSRSVIPFCRGKGKEEWAEAYPYLKHIGLYAYRRCVLHEVTCLPQSPLEIAESLEQLRWLENGYRIKVGLTEVETIGIDTPADLENAEKFIASMR